MSASEEAADQASGIAQVLEFGVIYYKNFSFVDSLHDAGIIKVGKGKVPKAPEDQPAAPAKSPRSSAQAARTYRSTTFFSISAAVMEVIDLTRYPLDSTDIVSRVRDTLFRGRREEILSCISALASNEFMKVEVIRKEETNAVRRTDSTNYNKYTCYFTEKYIATIRKYTSDICAYIVNKPEFPDNWDWVAAACSIFDFFRFRCMPEWYLLMRRILRVSPLPQDRKEKVYRSLFSGSSNMWFAINHYILWTSQTPSAERTYAGFSASLATYMTGRDSDRVIGEMIESYLCGMVGRQLLVQPRVRGFVAEYEREVNRECKLLRQTIEQLGKAVPHLE